MSPQQKAQNKAASRVKRLAHAQRYRDLRRALEAAESHPQVLAARAQAEAEKRRADEDHVRRKHQVQELRAQIAALEEQIRTVERDPTIQQIRQAEKAAWAAWRSVKQEKTDAAEAAYPDLAGAARYSSAAWTPPADVAAAMQAARIAHAEAAEQEPAG